MERGGVKRSGLDRDKRGLSQVVTTLLFILLGLVAIGVVWVVVSNILSSGAGSISINQFLIKIDLDKATLNGNNVVLTVTRAKGTGNLTGMKFIISDGLNSEDFVVNASLNELDTRTFTETLASLNPSNVKTASVAPYYLNSNGENTLGEITSTITFSASPPAGSGPVCGNGVCEAGETASSCSADCTSGGTSCLTNGDCSLGEQCISGTCQMTACNPACTGTDTCNNGVCVPAGCTETRTNAEVCNAQGAVCGSVQDTCGNYVNCDTAIGGCTVRQTCSANACVAITPISGTVASVWPSGIANYFDSSNLPTDKSYAGYWARFPGSAESECLQVENYDPPIPPQTTVQVRLVATQTSVVGGDNVELWPGPTSAACYG